MNCKRILKIDIMNKKEYNPGYQDYSLRSAG